MSIIWGFMKKFAWLNSPRQRADNIVHSNAGFGQSCWDHSKKHLQNINHMPAVFFSQVLILNKNHH